ncbi:GNAT family N-acetyltransferase [Actinokineospora sp. HUAS TT18]|uniref:GNAT family N-acetyltransferase n=1 Tax=Actinokineospora sp. HUAS TT18 TaxID=3447451 RepID=UPI003F5241A3
MAWTVETRPWDDAEGLQLRAKQQSELHADVNCDDHPHGPRTSAADVDHFVVAVAADGRAVACGGLRALSARSAEIEWMYVEPDCRGGGAAMTVLRALEGVALYRGWVHLQLKVGTTQRDAQRFYERAGYRNAHLFAQYGGSATSVIYELDLRVETRRPGTWKSVHR